MRLLGIVASQTGQPQRTEITFLRLRIPASSQWLLGQAKNLRAYQTGARSVIKKRAVADFYQLPKAIQDYLKLIRDWNSNGSYCELDVMSDADRDEWLGRVNDKYSRAESAISDYFKAQGADVGTDTVVVLRTW